MYGMGQSIKRRRKVTDESQLCGNGTWPAETLNKVLNLTRGIRNINRNKNRIQIWILSFIVPLVKFKTLLTISNLFQGLEVMCTAYPNTIRIRNDTRPYRSRWSTSRVQRICNYTSSKLTHFHHLSSLTTYGCHYLNSDLLWAENWRFLGGSEILERIVLLIRHSLKGGLSRATRTMNSTITCFIMMSMLMVSSMHPPIPRVTLETSWDSGIASCTGHAWVVEDDSEAKEFCNEGGRSWTPAATLGLNLDSTVDLPFPILTLRAAPPIHSSWTTISLLTLFSSLL